MKVIDIFVPLFLLLYATKKDNNKFVVNSNRLFTPPTTTVYEKTATHHSSFSICLRLSCRFINYWSFEIDLET